MKNTNILIEQLKQLLTVTWDGDLISKTDRDNLVKKGLAERYAGFNLLTLNGLKVLNQIDELHCLPANENKDKDTKEYP